MDYGVPLGRRFRALKLWFVLRSFGREGIAEMIRGACADGAGIRRGGGRRPTIRAHRAVAVFGGELPVQGNRRRESAHSGRVNATGEVFISSTVLRGRNYVAPRDRELRDPTGARRAGLGAGKAGERGCGSLSVSVKPPPTGVRCRIVRCTIKE